MLEKMSAIAAVVGGSGDGERDGFGRVGLGNLVAAVGPAAAAAVAFFGGVAVNFFGSVTVDFFGDVSTTGAAIFGFGGMTTSGGVNLMSLLRKLLKSVIFGGVAFAVDLL